MSIHSFINTRRLLEISVDFWEDVCAQRCLQAWAPYPFAPQLPKSIAWGCPTRQQVILTLVHHS